MTRLSKMDRVRRELALQRYISGALHLRRRAVGERGADDKGWAKGARIADEWQTVDVGGQPGRPHLGRHHPLRRDPEGARMTVLFFILAGLVIGFSSMNWERALIVFGLLAYVAGFAALCWAFSDSEWCRK